jgi:hypothetical protein
MREYRRIRRGMSWFLAAYFVGGLLTLLLPEREVFPVYSWFLFPLVPRAETQYALLLHEVSGQRVEPPCLYQDAEGRIPRPHSVTVFQLTQKFGAAFEHGQADQARYCELLEKNWLPARTRYELVKVNADPIARWKNGRFEITQRLEMFTSAGATP